MVIALYAGSFDPMTLGHKDIIETSSKIFEKVIIGVGVNPNKKDFIPLEDRIKLIKECVKNIPNTEVLLYRGLTTEFAKQNKVSVLIRGLRNTTDFEYEKELAMFNYGIDDSIKTVFLISKPEYSYISSSGIRELITHKSDISKFVPQNVSAYFKDNKNYF